MINNVFSSKWLTVEICQIDTSKCQTCDIENKMCDFKTPSIIIEWHSLSDTSGGIITPLVFEKKPSIVHDNSTPIIRRTLELILPATDDTSGANLVDSRTRNFRNSTNALDTLVEGNSDSRFQQK